MFRRFLPLNPRALRFFVLALAWVQLVAPTWHICALGGHTAVPHVAHSHAAAHHANAAEFSVAATGPLICFCAPHSKAPHLRPLGPRTPRLDGVSFPNHATCLALLLQTLPGQLSAPPAPVASRFISQAISPPLRLMVAKCAAPRRFPARAPPQKC